MQYGSSRPAGSDPGENPVGESFSRDGFTGPLPLFTAAQCALICRHLGHGKHPAPLDWNKGSAATDRFIYDLATRPPLLELLRRLIGDDIILWGASVVTRAPGQIHPWHTDMESSAPGGGFVTVWIGLRNTSRESALQLVRGSGSFGKTIQQVVQEHSLHRGEASAEMVLEWAREFDPAAEIVQPEMRDGEAILFDGRVWHGSDNTRSRGTRAALILQYAAANVQVHMPDFSRLEWPFQFRSSPRPPVITVSGTAPGDVNRLVPPPAAGARENTIVRTHLQSLHLPLAEDAKQLWKPYPIFRGQTSSLHDMSCHVSVLSPCHSPHPPHAHLEEELVVMLDGVALIVVADGPDSSNARTARMSPGLLVYYPAYQYHTIYNPGPRPVTYMMFKWRGAAAEAGQPLGTGVFHFGNGPAPEPARPFATRLLFQGPTSFLGRLHGHLTYLQPGAGYAPHRDAYDVAIVVLSGTVETLGRKVAPHGVIYYSAGELHGMSNIGEEPARYLVFEFHPPSDGANTGRQAGRGLTDPAK